MQRHFLLRQCCSVVRSVPQVRLYSCTPAAAAAAPNGGDDTPKTAQEAAIDTDSHLLTTPAMPQCAPYEVHLQPNKRVSWCSCGLSKKQPFCDGAHKKNTVFKPVRIVSEEEKTVWLCGCKRTQNPPYCDGTHNTLPEAKNAGVNE